MLSNKLNKFGKKSHESTRNNEFITDLGTLINIPDNPKLSSILSLFVYDFALRF